MMNKKYWSSSTDILLIIFFTEVICIFNDQLSSIFSPFAMVIGFLLWAFKNCYSSYEARSIFSD